MLMMLSCFTEKPKIDKKKQFAAEALVVEDSLTARLPRMEGYINK